MLPISSESTPEILEFVEEDGAKWIVQELFICSVLLSHHSDIREADVPV
jgi:hypothetical protein